MADYEELLNHIEIPRFAKVRYHKEQPRIEDISSAVQAVFDKLGSENRIKKGMRIAVTAGSRQISDYAVILRGILNELKKLGAEPFLVPAMGSHGGATAQGQINVLKEYGVTEESMGVPINSSMETVSLGIAKNGMEVRMDRFAYEADGIVLFNRIKAHTGFRGEIESGLMKMIVIGLGKQYGANICHGAGPENMSANIQCIADFALHHSNILLGIGVVENGYHQTYKIEGAWAENIFAKEKELLQESKKLMLSIPFQKADVLIVDEIGKNIAGEGMDPNITGRSYFIGNKAPYFESIAVMDITKESEGNGTGIGNADVISWRAFEKFRMEMTYPNCITSRDSKTNKIPVVMPNDKQTLQYALQICYGIDREKGPRIVWIKNTLDLEYFYISKALISEANSIEGMEIIEDCLDVSFDESGNVMSWR